MNNIRRIISCAVEDYIQWVLNTKQILLAVLLIFNYMLAVAPLVDRAKQMQEKICFLEPCIAIGSSGIILLILPIIFLLLISNYPFYQGNALFYIYRVGRQNWLWAQLILLFMIIVTYLIMIAVGSIIPAFGYCSFQLKWSPVVTKYKDLFPESAGRYELLPENLYYQIKSPLYAVLHTYVLLLLYLLLLGSILLVSSLNQNRKKGNTVSAFLIVGGATLCSIQSKWMWCFPMAHSITWLHFKKYLRAQVIPLWLSYLLLSLISTFMISCAFYTVRQFSFDEVEK